MAAAPGTTYGSTGGTAAPAPGKAPARQAAAQRIQRYYNKASGKMETAQQMRGYRPPAQMHPVPAGHQVSHTSSTTHRESTGGAPAKPEVSFINMTPREIEARAKAIVSAELKANREPFQQEQKLLGQEQTYGLNRNTEQFGKLGQTIEQQQNTQAGTAKTFENYAADQVNKASQATPGLAQTQERLGIPAGGKLPESVQRQQEASRTLLSGIAQAAQGGTTARQEAESNFLTNMRAAAAQQGVETGRGIEAQFGKQKAGVAGKEQALLARGAGTQSNLILKMLGEQEKLKTAQAGLGIKAAQTEQKGAATASQNARRAAQTKGEGAKIAQGNTKLAQSGALTKQRIKSAQSKERTEAAAREKTKAEIGDKARKLHNEWEKNQIAREKAGNKAGPHLTTLQINKYAGSLAEAFHTVEKIRKISGAANRNKEFAKIRNAPKTFPPITRAAEELAYFRRISPQTRSALSRMGIEFGSNAEAYNSVR